MTNDTIHKQTNLLTINGPTEKMLEEHKEHENPTVKNQILIKLKPKRRKLN